MPKISGLKVGLLAFVATGAVIVVPNFVTPAAARDNNASAALTAPAPLLNVPLAG